MKPTQRDELVELIKKGLGCNDYRGKMWDCDLQIVTADNEPKKGLAFATIHDDHLKEIADAIMEWHEKRLIEIADNDEVFRTTILNMVDAKFESRIEPLRELYTRYKPSIDHYAEEMTTGVPSSTRTLMAQAIKSVLDERKE
jgi:hypothetical protein